MSAGPYKVYVIVDPGFGERLADLPAGVPTWILDTAANKSVAARLQTEWPTRSHLTGITTFDLREHASPEETLLDVLGTVDEHHGPYSADPPYSQVEVIGTVLSDRIKAALRSHGFHEFRQTAHGFSASR